MTADLWARRRIAGTEKTHCSLHAEAVTRKCRLLEVPAAGHWLQWEEAELFNRETIAFLKQRA